MSTVRAEIVIDAPIERVWETIMDPGHLGDWVTIHKSVDNYPTGGLTQGDTMDQVMSVKGLSFRVHWRLESMRAPRRARWEGRGPAHSDASIDYELSSDGEGRTTFRYANEFHPPGGRLGSMASRFIVGATSEREAHASLSRLKSLLESR